MDRHTTDDRATVLVVDDDYDVADLYSDQLVDQYDVLTAYSVIGALDLVDESVDVVLLDRRMPDRSGDEVLAEIRDRDIDCRVVMVTAVEPSLDIVEMDFDDYLVKPVSQETLADAVSRMLDRDSLDEQLREILSLASTMATLESKMDVEELQQSSAYRDLEARFVELRDTIGDEDLEDDLYAEFATEKVETLIAKLGRRK